MRTCGHVGPEDDDKEHNYRKNELIKWKNKDSFLDLRKTLIKKLRLKKISNIENINKKKIIAAVKKARTEKFLSFDKSLKYNFVKAFSRKIKTFSKPSTKFKSNQQQTKLNLINMKRIINFSTAIKEAMFDSMKLDKKVIVYGLGFGTSVNIYVTSKGLKEKFGSERVFDAPAAESALTAMGTGMALSGARPILIHKRFDFMIYSLDQIVNWISLWSYKSAGKSQIPITIRTVVGKGWGQGPQHAKSLHSWFSNLPGVSVVYPSSPYESK